MKTSPFPDSFNFVLNMHASSLIFLSLILLSVHSLNLNSKRRSKETIKDTPCSGCFWPFDTATYNIRGFIKNAMTNEVFSSTQLSSSHVQVIFTSNGNNVSATVNADNSTYSIQLAPGVYTRWAIMDGMVPATTTVNISVADSFETQNSNSVLFAPIYTGWRAVLSWNTVQDLDAYVIAGSGYKVSFKTKSSPLKDVTLDVDNRNGSGPETATFNFTTKSAGSYKFFVNSYSKQPLQSSQAKVDVYHGNGQVGELQPPSAGSKAYWYVFKIDVASSGTQTFSVVNQYTDALA